MSLPVSRVIRATLSLSPIAAAARSFGVLMIAGDSNVISGLERYRSYETIDEVAADFGVNAPEYKAAALYFGQTPKPAQCMIGRWIRTASSGQNLGGILTPSQALMTNWNVISNGGFDIAIDGTVQNLAGLNFSGATNLNGVASIISGALSGATAAWDGSKFIITSSSSGAGSNASGTVTLNAQPSYGQKASGTITLSGQPSNGDSVTIHGTAVTFVTGTPSGNQVLIGASDTITAFNLQTFLQSSSDAGLASCTYNTIGLVTTISARTYSTAGNAITLAASGVNITVSGATLAGGLNPDTLTIDGTVVSFVPAVVGGNTVVVGPTLAQTSANLQGFLQSSSDVNILKATYSTSALVTTVAAVLPGSAGNAFTLATTSSGITLSGAVLSGGSVPSSVGYATAGAGMDISAMLELTASTSIALVPGYSAESPVQCAAILANKSAAWYGLMFAASVPPTDQQNLDVASFIEALDLTRVFGVTIVNPNVEISLVTNDLASLMKAGGYEQSTTQFSSTNPYAIASLFGRAFSVDFSGTNTTITLMYKQEPGVTAEDLDSDTADTLQAKRCNVFAAYENNTAILQYGTMAGPAYFDEIQGLDWFQNAIQTACFNLEYTSTTKIPQTDAGSNQFVNTINGVCQQAVNNGLAAPGVWNAQGFGELQTGQYLKNGYYVFVQPVALQSQSDREARKGPPITIALKLAGAIQEVDVLINVNR